MWRFLSTENLEGYTGGSLNSYSRFSLSGQAVRKLSDKEEYPCPPGWGLYGYGGNFLI
jgi:hypothetical protein